MKKLFLSIIMLAAMSAACFAQDVVGRWKLDDGTAIVEIYKKGLLGRTMDWFRVKE